MQKLKEIIMSIIDIFNVERQRKEFAEMYLAAAVDHHDLEARQRYLARMGYL